MKVAIRRLEWRYRFLHLADDYCAWRVQFEHQRIVFQLEYASYWSRPIDCCPNSKLLWQKIDTLLHPVSSTSVPHSSDDFNRYFTSKVEAIRVATASAPPPTINRRDVPPFPGFTSTTVEEVLCIIRDIPNKQCELDPIQTWLVKELCDTLAPVITTMAKRIVYIRSLSRHTQTRDRPFSTQEAFLRPD